MQQPHPSQVFRERRRELIDHLDHLSGEIGELKEMQRAAQEELVEIEQKLKKWDK